MIKVMNLVYILFLQWGKEKKKKEKGNNTDTTVSLAEFFFISNLFMRFSKHMLVRI